MKKHFYHNISATNQLLCCTICAVCTYCIVCSCVMCCKSHNLFKLLLGYCVMSVIDHVCTTASAFSPTSVSCYIVFFACCIVLSVFVLWIVILCCIFGDILYVINVVQELFKSDIVCLMYIICIIYHVFYALYGMSFVYCQYNMLCE